MVVRSKGAELRVVSVTLEAVCSGVDPSPAIEASLSLAELHYASVFLDIKWNKSVFLLGLLEGLNDIICTTLSSS